MSNCKKCCWHGECEEIPSATECEFYDPMDNSEVAIEAYKEDLRMREREYRDLIDEQEN